MTVPDLPPAISIHRYIIEFQDVVYQRWLLSNFQKSEVIYDVEQRDAVFAERNSALQHLHRCEADGRIISQVFQKNIEQKMQGERTLRKQIFLVVANEEQLLSECCRILTDRKIPQSCAEEQLYFRPEILHYFRLQWKTRS